MCGNVGGTEKEVGIPERKSPFEKALDVIDPIRQILRRPLIHGYPSPEKVGMKRQGDEKKKQHRTPKGFSFLRHIETRKK